jgi:hypothetical protein
MRYSNYILRCPNGCHVTDVETFRCPRCGKIMLKDGKVSQENKQRIHQESEQIQRANYDKTIR